jgi:2'-5' RNA ligase
VAWVRAEQLHFTVRFLGEVSEELVSRLSEELAPVLATHEAFDIELAGAGAFPAVERPRVIWVGVHDPTRLQSLAAKVEGVVRALGFPAEAREFVPHLTLGRVKRPLSGTELQALTRAVIGYGARFALRVTGVDLMSSVLRPQGPLYTMLHKFPLAR